MDESPSLKPILMSSVNILGVKIDTLPVEQVVEFIVHSIETKQKAVLTYANVHAVNLAQETPWFRDYLNQSAITYCDGYGLKFGARLLGINIPYRYTPPDWFPLLASTCAASGFSLYLLGARPGVSEKCANLLQNQFPGIKIAGTQHGYFNKSPGSSENQEVVSTINACSPDILVIGFGMPAQERWLKENWEQINARVALPVGALFDYYAQEIRRAPRWMTDHGLEWAGRLLVEPRRLWQRYIIGNPRFLWAILKQRLGVL